MSSGAHPKQTAHISVSATKVFVSLSVAAVALLGFHGIGLLLKFGLDHDHALGFVPLFDLDGEGSVPELYSSMLLVFSALLCLIGGWSDGRLRARWWVVAAVFVVLGIDEIVGVHEPLFFVLRGNRSERTAELADRLGGLTWWSVLPFLTVAFVALVAWCWPLIRGFSWRVRTLFVTAGVIYMTGVAVIDNIAVVENQTLSQGARLILAALEEMCELIGVSLFIYGALTYLGDIGVRLRFCTASEDDRGSSRVG